MDPEKGSDKVKGMRKPGLVLVSFFGDSSFGWFPPFLVSDFKEGMASKSKPSKRSQNFIKAVEEATEILDRRAGRKPKTHHDPFDFLLDKIDYLDDEGKNLLERIGWLPIPSRQTLPAAEVVRELRVLARNPAGVLVSAERDEVEGFGVTRAEQFAIWRGFDRNPKDVQWKMLPFGWPGSGPSKKAQPPKPAADKGGAEPAKPATHKSAERNSSAAAKPKTSDAKASSKKDKAQASKPSHAKTHSPHTRPPHGATSPAPPEKRKRGRPPKLKPSPHAAQAAETSDSGKSKKQARANSAAESRGGGSAKKRDPAASSARGGELDDEAPRPAEVVQAEQDFMALMLAAEAKRDEASSDGSGDRQGGAVCGVAVTVLETQPDPEEFAIIDGLEEHCTSAEVPLRSNKISPSKLCRRLWQLARNAGNAECYHRVLNPVNVAGFFKVREAQRVVAGTNPSCQTSSCTRDVLVGAWRYRNDDAPPEREEVPFDVAAVCVAPEAMLTVNVLSDIPLMRPNREMELVAMRDLSLFWRRRGLALPPLVLRKMSLDEFELMERVFAAGGYWAVTATQRPSLRQRNRSWQHLVSKCYTIGQSSIKQEELVALAATLQEWYRSWMLPYEQQCVRAFGCPSFQLPAALLRRLGTDTHSRGLGHLPDLVKALADEAKAPESRLSGTSATKFVCEVWLPKRLGAEHTRLLLKNLPSTLIEASSPTPPEQPSTGTAPELSEDSDAQDDADGDDSAFAQSSRRPGGRNAVGRKRMSKNALHAPAEAAQSAAGGGMARRRAQANRERRRCSPRRICSKRRRSTRRTRSGGGRRRRVVSGTGFSEERLRGGAKRRAAGLLLTRTCLLWMLSPKSSRRWL